MLSPWWEKVRNTEHTKIITVTVTKQSIGLCNGFRMWKSLVMQVMSAFEDYEQRSMGTLVVVFQKCLGKYRLKTVFQWGFKQKQPMTAPQINPPGYSHLNVSKHAQTTRVLGKRGYHIQKKKTTPLSLTLYKNKLKMDQRPYGKTWNSETAGEKLS